QALQKNPHDQKAWVLRAVVLTNMGVFDNEASFLNEAHHHFEKALSLIGSSEEPIYLSEFYWKWGCCLAALGKLSGEPLDFHQAIDKFHRADESGCHDYRFYLDFGHSYADLAALLEKSEYFAEAFQLFNQAVQLEPSSFEGWFHQACCLRCLTE